MRLALIVAIAENRVIGRDNRLPWRIPADLRHFKATTMGKPVIMGRKTFQSIGRPLPGRTNIVISRDPAFAADGVAVAGDFETALECANRSAARAGVDEVMVIGGAEIYAEALARADRIYLTEVHRAVDGDVHFPEIDRDQWRESRREDHPAPTPDGPAYSFVVLDRV